MLPTAESAWSIPRAMGRDRAGMTSATSETARTNTPPTPSPSGNGRMRSADSCRQSAQAGEREYKRIVISNVLARPIGRPGCRTEAADAHPIMKIMVVNPP